MARPKIENKKIKISLTLSKDIIDRLDKFENKSLAVEVFIRGYLRMIEKEINVKSTK